MTISQQQVDFGGDLFAPGLGKDGEVVAEEGEVIEDVVDLCTVDGGSRGGQLTDDALTHVISGKILAQNE